MVVKNYFNPLMFLKFDRTKYMKKEKLHNVDVQFALADKDNSVNMVFKFFISDYFQEPEFGLAQGKIKINYFKHEFTNNDSSNFLAN